MRRVSLNARAAHDAAASDEVEVALFVIDHPLLPAKIRLSTDPTERLSPGTAPLTTPALGAFPADELVYGTRSAWDGADPLADPYLFILASAELPDDQEDAAAAATIILENVGADIAELLLSFTDRALVHMAVVLASTPDLIEAEFRDMRLITSSGDASEISLQLSRDPIEEESVSKDRFTKHRFPGLFR